VRPLFLIIGKGFAFADEENVKKAAKPLF